MKVMPIDPNVSITIGGEEDKMTLIYDGQMSDDQILVIQKAVTESGYTDDDYEIQPMTEYRGLKTYDDDKEFQVAMLHFPNADISLEQADRIRASIHKGINKSVLFTGRLVR